MKVSMDMKYQGPADYADWVTSWSEDYGLSQDIDACLLGGRMYPGYEAYWSAMSSDQDGPSPMTGTVPTGQELAWLERIPNLPHYVLSKSLTGAAWPKTRFLRSTQDVAALKSEAGRNIYLMGGGEVIRGLIKDGLVDELRLISYPVVAGGPHSLFGPEDVRRSMELLAVEQLPGGLVRQAYRLLQATT